MAKPIPKCRPWTARNPVRNGAPDLIEVSAPTRFLAQLVAAERLGVPVLWTRSIRFHPITERKERVQ